MTSKPLTATAWVAAGVLLGITACFAYSVLKQPPIPKPLPDTAGLKRKLEISASFLIPEFSWKDALPDEAAALIIQSPSEVSVQMAEGNTPLTHGPYKFTGATHHFNAEGRKNLSTLFQSPNAYRGVTACGFNPVLLITFKKDNGSVEILVCLGCQDIAIPGKEPDHDGATAGLTDIGMSALLFELLKVFPEDETILKAARKH